jgi:hypothetical protein
MAAPKARRLERVIRGLMEVVRGQGSGVSSAVRGQGSGVSEYCLISSILLATGTGAPIAIFESGQKSVEDFAHFHGRL